MLTNKNAPHPAKLSKAEQSGTEDLLKQAIVIVSALGFNFFEPCTSTAQPTEKGELPQVPPNLKALLEELRKAATGPSLPKAQWYLTGTPDYRAKVVTEGDFRVFLRATWSKNWLRVNLKDIAKFNISISARLGKASRGNSSSLHEG